MSDLNLRSGGVPQGSRGLSVLVLLSVLQAGPHGHFPFLLSSTVLLPKDPMVVRTGDLNHHQSPSPTAAWWVLHVWFLVVSEFNSELEVEEKLQKQ